MRATRTGTHPCGSGLVQDRIRGETYREEIVREVETDRAETPSYSRVRRPWLRPTRSPPCLIRVEDWGSKARSFPRATEPETLHSRRGCAYPRIGTAALAFPFGHMARVFPSMRSQRPRRRQAHTGKQGSDPQGSTRRRSPN